MVVSGKVERLRKKAIAGWCEVEFLHFSAVTSRNHEDPQSGHSVTGQRTE
jgi:hypothetical protein